MYWLRIRDPFQKSSYKRKANPYTGDIYKILLRDIKEKYKDITIVKAKIWDGGKIVSGVRLVGSPDWNTLKYISTDINGFLFGNKGDKRYHYIPQIVDEKDVIEILRVDYN